MFRRTVKSAGDLRGYAFVRPDIPDPPHWPGAKSGGVLKVSAFSPTGAFVSIEGTAYTVRTDLLLMPPQVGDYVKIGTNFAVGYTEKICADYLMVSHQGEIGRVTDDSFYKDRVEVECKGIKRFYLYEWLVCPTRDEVVNHLWRQIRESTNYTDVVKATRELESLHDSLKEAPSDLFKKALSDSSKKAPDNSELIKKWRVTSERYKAIKDYSSKIKEALGTNGSTELGVPECPFCKSYKSHCSPCEFGSIFGICVDEGSTYRNILDKLNSIISKADSLCKSCEDIANKYERGEY